MRIVVLTILLMSSHTLYAQCTMVRGVVKDKQTGEALPGASVRFIGSGTDGVSVDADGAFELAITKVDSLIISFIGYDPLTIAIPADCFVTVLLTPSFINLTEVEIQAERLIAEEFTIRKMKKLEIYTNPSAKADPLLAVNSLPSATTLDESANISLRGSSPAETGIFLNNVPINDAVRYAQLNGIGTFSIFNTALINQVQVYPGNPPLDLGNTTSGLIALYTNEIIPENNTYSASLSLASIGLYMQRKLNKSSSLTAFTNYQPSAAIRWVNQKSLERLKDFSTVDLGLHYFSRLGKNTLVKIFNYSNIESFRYHTEQPTYSGIFHQHKKRNYTVSNVRHRFGNSELSWNSGANFSNSGFTLSTLDVSLEQRDFYTALNYQFQVEKFELKTGVSYDFRSNESKGTYPVYDFAMGEAYPSEAFLSSTQLHIPEAFLYGKYYLHPKWIVGTGIRKNIRTAQQPDFLSWQINLNVKPAEHWNIIASTGEYNKFQLPQNGESTVAHIQMKQYGVDISYTPSKLESSISVFYKSGKQNNLHLETKGIELYGRYRFNRNLRSQLSVTSLQATQTKNGVTSSSPYNIHYFVRGNTEYKIGGTWTISLVFMIRQGSFYNPVTEATLHPVGVYEPTYGEAKRLPDYNLLDISFSKLMIWAEKVTAVAFCGISNLPNFNNVRDYTYNFDYSQKKEDLFSLRTLYMGCMINF